MSAEAVYLLYEHASGYALLQVKEMEEIGQISAQAEAAAADVSKFNSLVKLVAYSPFKSSLSALENCNAISEGVLHEELRVFLQNNLPKAGRPMLGVAHTKLADAVKEELGDRVRCSAAGSFPELVRCCRQHFPKLVRGLSLVAENKAQIGLAHGYSRAKLKFNVNRADNMIIQAINLLDQLDKDINTFAMRVREWYGYHFPELVRLVADNPTYVAVASIVGDRKQYLAEQRPDELEAIVQDTAKVEAITDAMRSSMGMDISEIDLGQIRHFASRISAMIARRRQLHTYLIDKMTQVAPNLSTLIGDQVAARLIAHAGSLTNLAKFPASTVQILGAEKALFRALKTRGNTPKYGLIFHSTFIGKAAREHKGRVSRYLASKASIATRIDAFSEVPTSIFGEHLRKQVENRLAFLASGENPPKNAAVMAAAVEEAAIASTRLLRKLKRKEKKKKRERDSQLAAIAGDGEDKDGVSVDLDEGDGGSPKKKAKKRSKAVEDAGRNGEADVDLTVADEEETAQPKQKKKRKTVDREALQQTPPPQSAAAVTPSSKKQKRRQSGLD